MTLAEWIRQHRPALEAALDPVCVVDTENRLNFADIGARSLLEIRARELKSAPVFCDRLKLSVCEKRCQVLAAIEERAPARFDELPASVGETKLRMILKISPILDPDGDGVLGAVLCMRNTTAEIVLQAKYKKLIQLIGSREEKVRDLQARVESLLGTLKQGRAKATR